MNINGQIPSTPALKNTTTVAKKQEQPKEKKLSVADKQMLNSATAQLSITNFSEMRVSEKDKLDSSDTAKELMSQMKNTMQNRPEMTISAQANQTPEAVAQLLR